MSSGKCKHHLWSKDAAWRDPVPGARNGSGRCTTFRVPDDAKPGQTIDVILEATDSGTPPLTRYQRVAVTIH